MVITNNGKPIAFLTPLSDANIEDTLKSVRKAIMTGNTKHFPAEDYIVTPKIFIEEKVGIEG